MATGRRRVQNLKLASSAAAWRLSSPLLPDAPGETAAPMDGRSRGVRALRPPRVVQSAFIDGLSQDALVLGWRPEPHRSEENAILAAVTFFGQC